MLGVIEKNYMKRLTNDSENMRELKRLSKLSNLGGFFAEAIREMAVKVFNERLVSIAEERTDKKVDQVSLICYLSFIEEIIERNFTEIEYKKRLGRQQSDSDNEYSDRDIDLDSDCDIDLDRDIDLAFGIISKAEAEAAKKSQFAMGKESEAHMVKDDELSEDEWLMFTSNDEQDEFIDWYMGQIVRLVRRDAYTPDMEKAWSSLNELEQRVMMLHLGPESMSLQAIAALPEFSCKESYIKLAYLWGIETDRIGEEKYARIITSMNNELCNGPE